ncbi:heme lyase CcmF/NrfE family subunit [Noviherbaspirillum sedimenti]|uniref:Heme lyase CcmF/NrfE family subunit n=1 Tax=Noviherbaspirillum sedimenti TaxID=2320865 RepID=A0A3A3G3H8_9BURK|nr:heme lyase CcmF/NrfE family subunit [Noviherbaspirillum sedimenti]RJG03037.1 heme lyase CcmF/NrfE family subunit [Noviherbaspirillum sedimenti]
MIAELGQWCLALALVLALLQAALPLLGATRGVDGWMRTAHAAARAQALFLALAFVCLLAVLLGNDFSVRYVANHSNSGLPAIYRFAAAWGGHEGSLLLWTLLLAAWSALVSWRSDSLPLVFSSRVLAILGIVSSGFLCFMLFTSNPFERLWPAPPDGGDLNPLLQDPGLVIHPPMLYIGYVGLAVPFAFAVAALLTGRIDSHWARWCRPWTIGAWLFLTLGIALGSAWAYYELGWGGWWFWDPVENASFMPWLLATALMHSLAVTEKRGVFAGWTLLLAIAAFGLSLLGTFLVRSGVLTSVHAFAADPGRGVFLLALFAFIIGGALCLYAWRRGRLASNSSFAPFSREGLLMLNNVFLSVATASVLLGTVYPLALDSFGLAKISVGAPYFEAVFVPLMAPMLFLMGVGPLMRWKQGSLPDLKRRLKWALFAALAFGLVTPYLLGASSIGSSLGLALAGWLTCALIASAADSVRHRHGLGAWRSLAAQPLAYHGMLLAHFGIVVLIVGVTMVGGYASERTARMAVGDALELRGYRFRFDAVETLARDNYQARRASISVTRDGQPVTLLQPEKRFYPVQRSVMTEAAIDPGLTRDLYVALGEELPDGAWILRLYHKPFISWIWAGCLLMACGGLLALGDRRYRMRTASDATPVAAAPLNLGVE